MTGRLRRWGGRPRGLAMALWAAACGRDGAVVEALPDWTMTAFPAPMAVLHEPLDDVYLVAQAPADAPAAIARVYPDGRVQPAWILDGRAGAALHAPRGMVCTGDVLRVVDIDTVRSFDRGTGRPLAALTVPGAISLADLSVDPSGAIWVTDPALSPEGTALGAAAVFVIGIDGVVERLALDGRVGRPSGIVAQRDAAYLVTWDSGEFLMVDRRGHVERLGTAPTAELSGLCRVAPGRWLASSRAGHCLYEFGLGGGVPARLAGFEIADPGDFDLDARRHRLLLPSTRDGWLAARRLP